RLVWIAPVLDRQQLATLPIGPCDEVGEEAWRCYLALDSFQQLGRWRRWRRAGHGLNLSSRLATGRTIYPVGLTACRVAWRWPARREIGRRKCANVPGLKMSRR